MGAGQIRNRAVRPVTNADRHATRGGKDAGRYNRDL